MYAIGDIFHEAALKDAQRRRQALALALRIYRQAENAQPTETHRLIRRFADDGKLI